MAARQPPSRVTIWVMILLSLTVLVMSGSGIPGVKSVRGAVLDALTPVQHWVGDRLRPVGNWLGTPGDYDEILAENEALRERVQRLEAAAIENADAAAELQKLREQLDLPIRAEFETVVAQLTPGGISNFDDFTIQIDKGTDADIVVGNPVVSFGGLVGRVIEVSEHNALVRLLTHPDMAVSVKLAGTGNYAVGHGIGVQNLFEVNFGVELTDPVELGESVITSGLSNNNLYPPGIPIGTVVRVDRSPADQSQTLQVRLGADLAKLSMVSVVKWVPQDA